MHKIEVCCRVAGRRRLNIVDIPTVVPAECMLYFSPLSLSRRWTSAICCDTEAVGVPRGMRQKSAVHLGGVSRSAIDGMMTRYLVRALVSNLEE